MSSQTCPEVCLLGDSKIHPVDKTNHQKTFIIGTRVYDGCLTYLPHSLDYESFGIRDAASLVPGSALMTYRGIKYSLTAK